MASAVAGVAVSSFAQGIVQRTTIGQHNGNPQHLPVTATNRPKQSAFSALLSSRHGGNRSSALGASRSLAGCPSQRLKGLKPPTVRWQTRGSRGGPVRSLAGAAAGGSSAGEPAKGTEENKVTLGSRVRAILFYVATLLIAVPLFVVMLVIFPFQYLFDRYRRRALHVVNNVWANATTALFYKIEVIGAENLPPKDTPAVYIANHQSYLDIFSLFRLWVPFKFVSKTSNFLLPIVGWSMFLTGHIPLKRMDARSQAQCLKACRKMLDNGGSVIFFPEGTRSKDQKLGQFKKGAFSIATKANMPIVPITLVGTGKLMPSGKEGSLHTGGVKIIVHPPMTGTDPNQLMAESREVIYNTLVECGAE